MTEFVDGVRDQKRGETMNALIHMLTRSGLLTKDLDYHLIRASMVLIFLAFGYQKWFAYEAQVLIPYISNGPLIFWMYPVFGIRGASWFSGRFRMVVRCAAVPGILEQATGNLGSYRVDYHIRDDDHDHPVHAEWLGSGCRISGDGRQRSLPDEGCRPLGGVDLLAETGCRASA